MHVVLTSIPFIAALPGPLSHSFHRRTAWSPIALDFDKSMSNDNILLLQDFLYAERLFLFYRYLNDKDKTTLYSIIETTRHSTSDNKKNTHSGLETSNFFFSKIKSLI